MIFFTHLVDTFPLAHVWRLNIEYTPPASQSDYSVLSLLSDNLNVNIQRRC